MTTEAFVLWVDMLGYKNWLDRQTSLDNAEVDLLRALRFTFSTIYNESQRSSLGFGISSILIGDTILFWSYETDVTTLIALCCCYQILAAELAKAGLPLRGAFARGKLKVRDIEPRTIIGNSIIFCATAEKTMNCFAVKVHTSVIDYLRRDPREEMKAFGQEFIQGVVVATKAGDQENIVLKWKLPLSVLYIRLFNSLRERAGKDRDGFSDLLKFCPKFLGSANMFATIDDAFLPSDKLKEMKNEWNKALDLARDTYKHLEQ